MYPVSRQYETLNSEEGTIVLFSFLLASVSKRRAEDIEKACSLCLELASKALEVNVCRSANIRLFAPRMNVRLTLL